MLEFQVREGTVALTTDVDYRLSHLPEGVQLRSQWLMRVGTIVFE